jgi:hypothetical protein
MPRKKQPMTAETEFIAEAALLAASGRPDLAILAGRFVEMLQRAGLGGTLRRDEKPRSYTTRPANVVSVTAQIDRENLRVSLYGPAAAHAALHGPDCLLAFSKGRVPGYATTTVTLAQLADLQAHAELAAALKAQRAATRKPVAA